MKYQLLWFYMAGQVGVGITSTSQVISFDSQPQAEEAYSKLKQSRNEHPQHAETIQVVKLWKETPDVH